MKTRTTVNGRLPATPKARRPEATPPDAIADWIDVATAARWLGVRADCVRGWILRGELAPVYNVGSTAAPRYRIPVATVLAKFAIVQPIRLE